MIKDYLLYTCSAYTSNYDINAVLYYINHLSIVMLYNYKQCVVIANVSSFPGYQLVLSNCKLAHTKYIIMYVCVYKNL